jgi:hypothetical protein
VIPFLCAAVRPRPICSDVRGVQRRGRAGFLLESMEAIDVGRECAGQYLDRNVTPEPRIARAIDLAHAAGSDRRGDLVDAEAGTGGEDQTLVVDYTGWIASADWITPE